MLAMVKSFWKDEEGLGTLELILIVAVLVGLAIAFRDKIGEWTTEVMDKTDKKIDNFN